MRTTDNNNNNNNTSICKAHNVSIRAESEALSAQLTADADDAVRALDEALCSTDCPCSNVSR